MERTPVVYLIGGADLVKIGTTGDIKRRFKELQIDSPVQLRLLAYGAGGLRAERRLHKQFAACRRHGEWFNIPADELPPLIQSVNKGQTSRCSACGNGFTPSSALRSYCSSKCRGSAAQRRRISCLTCHNAFTPRNPQHRYCSKACRPAGVTEPPGDRVCRGCSTTFQPRNKLFHYCANCRFSRPMP